jgi:hypothetical protein
VHPPQLLLLLLLLPSYDCRHGCFFLMLWLLQW